MVEILNIKKAIMHSKKRQALQWEEIEDSGRRISPDLGRQNDLWLWPDLICDLTCDWPGYNASRCTAAPMDTQTNKILHFRVVDVVVSDGVLIFFS